MFTIGDSHQYCLSFALGARTDQSYLGVRIILDLFWFDQGALLGFDIAQLFTYFHIDLHTVAVYSHFSTVLFS